MAPIGPRCLAARGRLAHFLHKRAQPLRPTCGHLDQSQLLTASHKKSAISGAPHLKLAPETNFPPLLQPALGLYTIPKTPGLTIIDLGPDHYRINLGLRHPPQIKAEFSRKLRPASLNHSQIGKVVHDPAHVGVIEHHLILGEFIIRVCFGLWHGVSVGGPGLGGKRLREAKW